MENAAFKCYRCGAINITRYDGMLCGNCDSELIPLRDVIFLDTKETRSAINKRRKQTRNGYQPLYNLKSDPPNCGSSVATCNRNA